MHLPVLAGGGPVPREVFAMGVLAGVLRMKMVRGLKLNLNEPNVRCEGMLDSVGMMSEKCKCIEEQATTS